MSEEAILEVFDYWAEHATGKGRTPVLGTKRRAKISARLREGFTPADLKLAVDGALMSPWHNGQNPSGKKYLDIVTIFRDEAQVEKFMDLAETSFDPAEEFLRSRNAE